MNKTVLILLLAFSYVSAFTQWGGSGGFGKYGGYGGYSKGRWSGGFTGGWDNANGNAEGGVDSDYTDDHDDSNDVGSAASIANGGAYSCSFAINTANRAFDQLIEDARTQVNEWIVYSDLEAVDEASYYLANSCGVQNIDVVSQGSQACQGLGELLNTVVQQSEAGAFREDYQQGVQLTEQALSIGENVERSCQVRVILNQQEQQNQEELIEQPQHQRNRKAQVTNFSTQKHDSLANNLYKKFAKDKNPDFSQYGNEVANQYSSKYAGQYTTKYAGQYANQYTNKNKKGNYGDLGNKYGKDYIDQGKNMTRLGSNGQGQKYGEDQADLSNKINKEYTAKYGKKNEYQEKYQHNNEEEDNLKNEESNLNDLFVDLTWM